MDRFSEKVRLIWPAADSPRASAFSVCAFDSFDALAQKVEQPAEVPEADDAGG